MAGDAITGFGKVFAFCDLAGRCRVLPLSGLRMQLPRQQKWHRHRHGKRKNFSPAGNY
jgi:hypothetical protein